MRDRMGVREVLRSVITASALVALISVCAVAPPASAEEAAKTNAAMTLVQQAAEALGGAQRLREVRNITLAGYGQMAWNIGAEEISASEHVPLKYQALNDLRRVYDLEHDRYQARERGFVQFPFLNENAYKFAVVDRRLDGDIAFDTEFPRIGQNPGPPGPRRISANGAALFPDSVHVRRMWMLTNPVALVRAMMDPANTVSQPRIEGKYQVAELTLKQGDRLSVGFFSPSQYCASLCQYLPAFVRWTAPNPNLGEAIFTTWITGYASIQGLMLPLAFDTHVDWHDNDWYRLYVDHYDINTDIPDLSAPQQVRAMPVPPDVLVRPITVEKVADHIWRLAPNGTTVIEFKDHLTLFEIDAPPAQAKAIIEFARTLVPGKPVTQVIASHEHFDHVVGLREAVAEGLEVISRRPNGEEFQYMIDHPTPTYPDSLSRSPKPLKFVPVDEKLVLSDSMMTLWVLWTRNNIHMVDSVVAYAPAQKVIMEGDVATAAYIWQNWGDNFRDIIDYYHLDVKLNSPVHSVWPEHPGVLTLAQTDELIKGGVERARQNCIDWEAKGYVIAGCPIWSKRY
jgi:glyoxylase-like metal-dependent hydrolase (beta-lactamase superfamily II)